MPPRQVQPARDIFVEVANLAESLTQLRIVVEDNVVNLSNTTIDMLNDTAVAIQESFGGRPQQRPIREQVPVAQRIRRPAGVITNHHIRDLLRNHVPDLEEDHDTIVRTE